MYNKYKNVLLSLHNYCRKESFIGYSLYDSHNSFIPFEKFGRSISFYVNQIIKRSPINIRPLIGVKKGINPKAYGLLLNSYSKIKSLNILNDQLIDSLNHKFFNRLVENYSKGYSGYCWGYNYDWPQKNGEMIPAYTPSGVVTGFNCSGIFSYFNAYQNDKAKAVISDSASFVLNDLHLSDTKYGLCFSYTPVKKDLTINANLLAAEVLAYDDYLHKKKEHRELILGVLDFTKNLQNEDGSWYYSHNIETFEPKKQIDFHQGYVLETMDIILKLCSIKDDVYEKCITMGLEFYYKNQFSAEGTCYWRFPSKWPVDIHNQSQGIITFSRFAEKDEKYLHFAKKITDWTIKNMQGSKGNFYYQKWPLLTNKVNYMRWNQAWMLLALTTLFGK